jgi:predicted alpha/beta-hydrolase family hydrolase
LLASLLVVGSIALLGLGAGASANSPAPASGPLSTAAVLIEDVSQTTVRASIGQCAARRVAQRAPAGETCVDAPHRVAMVDMRRARWQQHAAPSWRGPPVLLI